MKKKHNIIAFDSTLVGISSKLLQEGMQMNQKESKKYVKFSMAFSNVPVHSKIFTQQGFVSEDLALKELIKECPLVQTQTKNIKNPASTETGFFIIL